MVRTTLYYIYCINIHKYIYIYHIYINIYTYIQKLSFEGFLRRGPPLSWRPNRIAVLLLLHFPPLPILCGLLLLLREQNLVYLHHINITWNTSTHHRSWNSWNPPSLFFEVGWGLPHDHLFRNMLQKELNSRQSLRASWNVTMYYLLNRFLLILYADITGYNMI